MSHPNGTAPGLLDSKIRALALAAQVHAEPDRADEVLAGVAAGTALFNRPLLGDARDWLPWCGPAQADAPPPGTLGGLPRGGASKGYLTSPLHLLRPRRDAAKSFPPHPCRPAPVTVVTGPPAAWTWDPTPAGAGEAVGRWVRLCGPQSVPFLRFPGTRRPRRQRAVSVTRDGQCQIVPSSAVRRIPGLTPLSTARALGEPVPSWQATGNHGHRPASA